MPPRQREAPMLLVKLRTDEGQDFRVVTDRVLSFKYTDRERRADVCKLTIDNGNLENFDDPVFKKGSRLIVQWGYPGRMSPARQVIITSVKGFKRLEIEATSEAILLNTVTRVRTFENRTISQVVTDMATEAGFSGDSLHIEETTEVIDTITQSRLTDAQFIRRWASRLGFEFYVDWEGFHFHPRRLGEAPVRTFRYFTDPNEGDILDEPNVDNDVTARPGRVRARGRDALRREDIDEAADDSTDSDRDVLAPITEVLDPEDGSTTHVGYRLGSEEVVPVAAPGGSTEARTRARARFRRAQQVAVRMTLPVIGDPQLYAKTVIQIEGMGIRLSIRYWVSEVEHDLSPGGYRCNLKLVSDGHGGHATTSSRARGLELLEQNRPEPTASGVPNEGDAPEEEGADSEAPLREVVDPETGRSTFR